MRTPRPAATSSTPPSTIAAGRVSRSWVSCSKVAGIGSWCRRSTRCHGTDRIPTRQATIARTSACRSIRASAACARTTSTSAGCTSGMRTPRSRKPCGRSTTSCATARSSTSVSRTRPRGSSPTPTPSRPSAVGPDSRRSKRHTACCRATSNESSSRWHTRLASASPPGRRSPAASPVRQVHAPGWARAGNQGLAGHAHRTRPGRGPERRRDRQRSGSERIAGRDRLDESTVERGPSHRRDRSPRSAARQSRRGRLHAAARGPATSRRCVRIRRRLPNRLHQRNTPLGVR